MAEYLEMCEQKDRETIRRAVAVVAEAKGVVPTLTPELRAALVSMLGELLLNNTRLAMYRESLLAEREAAGVRGILLGTVGERWSESVMSVMCECGVWVLDDPTLLALALDGFWLLIAREAVGEKFQSLPDDADSVWHDIRSKVWRDCEEKDAWPWERRMWTREDAGVWLPWTPSVEWMP